MSNTCSYSRLGVSCSNHEPPLSPSHTSRMPRVFPLLMAAAIFPLVHCRSIGSYVRIAPKGIDTFDITTTTDDILRVVFFSPSTVRIWLAPLGNFSNDPASADIVVGTPIGIKANSTQTADSLALSGGEISLVVDKATMKMSMQRKEQLLWTESKSLDIGESRFSLPYPLKILSTNYHFIAAVMCC